VKLQHLRRDGRPRPSRLSEARQISGRRRESLILQAQEKKGQTQGGVIRTEGILLHPRFHGTWTLGGLGLAGLGVELTLS